MQRWQGLVLASSSPYRKNLLRRLTADFITCSPEVNEDAIPGESAETLALRLARSKALTVCDRLRLQSGSGSVVPGPVVIGSDQVGCIGQRYLGKPGSAEQARAQLLSLSGQRVQFHTAVHLLDAISRQCFETVIVTTCQLRTLTQAEVDRYIERDQPLDCAGSFKIESAGISLFESVISNDPTALEGLPLIAVCKGLRQLGVQLP